MTIEEIPADKLTTMTKVFYQAFVALGCNPTCHCCNKIIAWDNKFKLATVDTYGTDSANSGISAYATEKTREVMLCEKCTIEDMNKQTAKDRAAYAAYRRSANGGCYRINGKIKI